jgi:hypothetical protein
MAVKFTKPEINVREKISELDKPSGVAGEAMLRADTVAEQQALIGVGRRNIIVNGSMNVSQRGTTFDKNSFTGAKYFSLDRFHIQSSIPSCDHTITQSTDTPNGFGHSLKYTQDTAASTFPAAAAQYHRLRHHIEGQDCHHLENEPCVLSFWVKSSIVGGFDVTLFAPNSSSNHMVLPYNIHRANTWEKKELSFIGPATITAGAVAMSLDVQWQLARSGTQYQTSATSVWGQTKLSSADSTDAIIKTAGATWQITGVQLELGKVATPFEYRSYGEELALCQRYFERLEDLESTDSNGGSSTETLLGLGYCYTTTRIMGHVTWKATKRVNPTCTVSPVTDIQCLSSAGLWISASAVDVRANKNSARLDITTGSAMPAAGQACEVRFNTASPVGYIYIDAEL